MEKQRRKIGIMGGTFDPIHVGHLILAEAAFEQFQLEKVWFIPSGNPPHKKFRDGRATDEQRLEMVRRGIRGNPHFECVDIEMKREGFSYTYLTLQTLTKEYPETDFYFIIGADSLFDFDDWREPRIICEHCILVCAVRDCAPEEALIERMEEISRKYHGKVLRLGTRNIDISSSLLREWVKAKRSIRYYTPDSVAAYICENHIYD